MNYLIISLSLLSLIAVLLAIVFEGLLKSQDSIKPSFKSFINEFKKLSFFGWLLIGVSVMLGFGNGYFSIKTINDNEWQYNQDTIKLGQIITHLKNKSKIDSLTILGLEKILQDNGLKSDSLKLTLVDNAVRTIEEQRKAIERERENTFSHFQKEIEENLRKILLNYEQKHIKGFSDTSLFVATRLSNLYIKKYELISTNKTIINYLMVTSDKIDVVNQYADAASEFIDKPSKQLNVRMFLSNVNSLKPDLLEIYGRIYLLKSYRQCESIDFTKADTNVNEKALEEIIKMQYLLREKLIR